MLREGKPIETNGTGNFDVSYPSIELRARIGTLIDATTGLIYVGNGQYYDPETGRFLTRGVNPNSPNPYVPFNPIGAIFAPLALASIYYSRKKGKKSPWIALLFVGLFLAGCTTCDQLWEDAFPSAETPPANTQVPTDAVNVEPTQTIAPPSPTPKPTNTDGCPGCTPNQELDQLYKIEIKGTWDEDAAKEILAAVKKIGEEFVRLGTVGSTSWDAFKNVYGEGVTFSRGGDSEGNICYGKKQEVMCSGTSPMGFERPDRYIVHELGHTLVQTRYSADYRPYLDVRDNIRIVNDRPESSGGPQWVTGTHPSWTECNNNTNPTSVLANQCAATGTDDENINDNHGYFQRTSLGYTGRGIPHQYHGETDRFEYDFETNPNEDFADMFLNWAYNSFDRSDEAYNAGNYRYKEMEDHMLGWIIGGSISYR